MRGIRFTIERTDTGVDAVWPYLGERSLVELVGMFETRRGYRPADGYAGLAGVDDPRGYYLPSSDARVWLLGCDCGEAGCWPLSAVVSVSDDRVTWSDFAQPFRPTWSYDGFGPFVFDRGEYEAAVAELVTRSASTAR